MLALEHANLLDIDDVPPLDQSDHETLEAIKNLLAQHDKLDRFGVCLLHTHFNISENEILVETCDLEKRELLTKPVRKDKINKNDIQETTWRFDNPSNSRACFKTCVANGAAGTHRHTHVKG